MTTRFMIYGATGYTGNLTVRMAKQRGLAPVLAGRNASKLKALAEPLGFEYRVAPLEKPEQLEAALGDIEIMLNIAGPFSTTAGPIVDACLRTGTHYLDITGEIPVFEALQDRDAEAKSRGVMIMPGVGFAVVPSDCLAAHVAARLPETQYLRIGISRADYVSRGSAKTMVELINDGVRIRRHGELTAVPLGRLERYFDFGRGERVSTAISWADVFTAFYTTSVPNIEVYAEANPLERGLYQVGGTFAWLLKTPPWQQWFKMQARMLPATPLNKTQAARKRTIVAEAEDRWRRRIRSRLRTPDGYTFTAITALEIIERILNGELTPGFQTPARVYGRDFVLTFEGVSREDLAA